MPDPSPDDDWPAFHERRNGVAMPPSVPPGLRLELLRARIRPGMSARTDEWMAMTNRRDDQCVATLPGERMAFEPIFRVTEADGTERMYHLAVYGDGGGTIVPDPGDLDREHIAFSRECEEVDWEILRPEMFVATELVRAAMVRSATDPLGPLDASNS